MGYCICCGAKRGDQQHDGECIWYGRYDNLIPEDNEYKEEKKKSKLGEWKK